MSISEANIIIQEIDGSDVNNQTGMEEIDSISMRVCRSFKKSKLGSRLRRVLLTSLL